MKPNLPPGRALRSAHFNCLMIMALTACLLVGCESTPPPAATTGHAIFDEQTSGKALVDAALEEAQAGQKHVLLLFGANWCPYCRQLHGLLDSDPALRELVASSYVVVPIDVGTSARNRNTALIDRYRATVFSDGTPALVVIDSQGDRRAPTKDNPWSTKYSVDPAQLRQFLTAAKAGAK